MIDTIRLRLHGFSPKIKNYIFKGKIQFFNKKFTPMYVNFNLEDPQFIQISQIQYNADFDLFLLKHPSGEDFLISPIKCVEIHQQKPKNYL